MGKDPSTVAKLEDADRGLGDDDAYVAIMDVYHQLHCLNTPRKLAYAEYYNTVSPAAHNHTKKKAKCTSYILATALTCQCRQSNAVAT
jgi:hypothetical protein